MCIIIQYQLIDSCRQKRTSERPGSRIQSLSGRIPVKSKKGRLRAHVDCSTHSGRTVTWNHGPINVSVNNLWKLQFSVVRNRYLLWGVRSRYRLLFISLALFFGAPWHKIMHFIYLPDFLPGSRSSFWKNKHGLIAGSEIKIQKGTNLSWQENANMLGSWTERANVQRQHYRKNCGLRDEWVAKT